MGGKEIALRTEQMNQEDRLALETDVIIDRLRGESFGLLV